MYIHVPDFWIGFGCCILVEVALIIVGAFVSYLKSK